MSQSRSVFQLNGGESLHRVHGAWEALEQAMALAVSDMGEDWVPPVVEMDTRDERGRPWAWTYFPMWVAQVFVLRDRAIDVAGPILDPYGLRRPLVCAEERLEVFAAALVEGALDERRAKIRRFSSGKIMEIDELALHLELVVNAGAFRLAEDPRGPVYFTGELVDRLESTGLTDTDQFRRVL